MTLAGRTQSKGTGGHPTVNPGLPLILSDILSPFFGPRRDFSPAFMRSGNHWTIPPSQSGLTVRSIKIETLWWDFWRSLSDFEVICAEPTPKPQTSPTHVLIHIWKPHLLEALSTRTQEWSLHSTLVAGICVAWAGPWYRYSRMSECHQSNVSSQESISHRCFMWPGSGYQYSISGLTGAICTSIVQLMPQ